MDIAEILIIALCWGMCMIPPLLFLFVRRSARSLDRLSPLRVVAAGPGRRLLGTSGVSRSTCFVTFGQGRHRLRLARVGPARPGKRDLLEVTLPLAAFHAPPFAMEVATKDWPVADRPALLQAQDGWEAVEMEDEALSERYRLAATHPTRARRLMDQRLVLGLRQLDELFRQDGGYLGLTQRWAFVRKVATVADAAAAEHIFRVAASLFEVILEDLGAPSLIEPAAPKRPGLTAAPPALLPPGALTLLPAAKEETGPIICGVCGDMVGPDGVSCPACGVPLHSDCHEYFGGCATYGCPGRPPGAD